MKDTKYNILITIVLILNLLALYVLNFVSFEKKDEKSEIFLQKLSLIDEDHISLDFIKGIKKSKKSYITKDTTKKNKTKIEKKLAYSNKKPPIKKVKPLYKKTIKVVKSDDIYKQLKSKFEKTHDFKIALKLSRLYYVKKRYKTSLKWAMIANELNKKDDGSWILFAKSKVKLGEKKLAKKALLTYSKTYDSKRVKELLNRIDL